MPLTADSTFISDTIFGLETNKFSKMRAMGASEDEIRLFSKTYLYRSFFIVHLGVESHKLHIYNKETHTLFRHCSENPSK